MLIARMPLSEIVISDETRCRTVGRDELVRPIVDWDSDPLRLDRDLPAFLLGGSLRRIPRGLQKVVRVSPSGRHITETVYARDGNAWICLYTKVIGQKTHISASVRGIGHYHAFSNILSLSEMIDVVDCTREPDIVEPIFTQDELNDAIINRLDIFTTDYKLVHFVDQLIDQFPEVYYGLLKGTSRSPSHELTGYHPHIQILPERHSLLEKARLWADVTLATLHYDHPLMDPVMSSLFNLRVGKFSVTSLITHALDGLTDLMVARQFEDPYLRVIPIAVPTVLQMQQTLRQCFYTIAKIHCEQEGLDPECFGVNKDDRSVITIERTLKDDILITIHDRIHDLHSCYYTNLPSMILTNWAIGYKLPVG